MSTPYQESIGTFMSVTGSSELVAIQKLTEHGGNLNEAINAHFTEGDRNIHEKNVAAPQDDFMDIDEPSQVAPSRPPASLPSARDMDPLSLLDPNFNRRIIDSGPRLNVGPFVSHPREVRQVPIEVKDGTSTESDHPESAPRIEEVTEASLENVPGSHGTVIIDNEENDDFSSLQSSHPAQLSEQDEGIFGGISHDIRLRPSAPVVSDLPDYGIEEEMIRAAIEASKRDAELGRLDDAVPHQRQSHLEDPELAHAVSLSLKTAEQEKALRELETEVGPSEPRESKLDEFKELGTLASSNGRLAVGSSSIQDETDDADEQPLVWRTSRHMSSSSIDTAKEMGEVDLSLPSSPPQQQNINHPGDSETDFRSDEWGGISSEEHDEAVMLEAALFGGVPEGTGYRVPYASHHYLQNGLDRTVEPYPRLAPRPPSPSLTAQRLIRDQQDDEYLASLQADREKELQEQAAREAAVEEERQKEEEAQRKLEEEQEIERQLAAKEASLPQEPTSDDKNAVTLLVRMPDGSRRGRRFIRTDKLQYLFDFIDIGRVVKPGTYRLVRPYPRHAFSDGESNLTLNELGLTSKQEALFLELI